MKAILHSKRYGAGEPLIILHGLFGCWNNWHPVARELSRSFCVYVPDLRNHGQSFHSERFDYDAMVQDLREFMDGRLLDSTALLGHSMGGKVALRFAALYPERVNKLIVVDITHKACGPVYDEAVAALSRLDLKSIVRLKDAEEKLRSAIPDPAVRLFLLKNLDRLPQGAYCWKVNLEAIRRNLPLISGPVEIREFSKPCLFIRGADSGYIPVEDWPEIRRFFPRAEWVTIPASGHWPHVQNPDAFLQAVGDFLDRS
jgi:pimeloyl-ACP methyl ester carboxylesterase